MGALLFHAEHEVGAHLLHLHGGGLLPPEERRVELPGRLPIRGVQLRPGKASDLLPGRLREGRLGAEEREGGSLGIGEHRETPDRGNVRRRAEDPPTERFGTLRHLSHVLHGHVAQPMRGHAFGRLRDPADLLAPAQDDLMVSTRPLRVGPTGDPGVEGTGPVHVLGEEVVPNETPEICHRRSPWNGGFEKATNPPDEAS